MSKTNRCTECGSGQTYVRLETHERVCRLCGAIKPIKSKPKALPIDPGFNPEPEVKQP